jgi:hypothetical protein
VRDHLEALNGAIQIEQLPAYAPELNPTEYIGGHLKHHELANRCAADFRDLKTGPRNRLRSMQPCPTLIGAFWRRAELQYWHVRYLCKSEQVRGERATRLRRAQAARTPDPAGIRRRARLPVP